MERQLLIITILVIFCCKFSLHAQKVAPWGDQGNGTFINPIINADYSDPDVIRVGEKYYMICSEFQYIGMTIQESDDMVNWRIVGRIYDSLPAPEYNTMNRYRGGSWAPALRYHDDKFWVFFCTPHEGLFMTTATDPRGPWATLHLVKGIAGWEDPCPFWDDDGKAYLGRSRVGAGPIIIHRMSPDGRELLCEGDTVYVGPVAEGTKFLKRNGYYYLSIPEGGVRIGYQTILRSKNIYGPYERRIALHKGSTDINGPHQGALVDTPEGEWWFYHYQWKNVLGRVLHLQPVFWHDDWPHIGVDYEGDGIGEPVHVWKKPDVDGEFSIERPATSDDFSSDQLGLQWLWNHNPVNSAWSLTEQPGSLTLNAIQASELRLARNTLTQKTMGYVGEATVELDVKDITEGQRAGLSYFSNIFFEVGITSRNGELFVYHVPEEGEYVEESFNSNTVYLRVNINLTDQTNQFSYSVDNKAFKDLGDPFEMTWGNWKGPVIGLYNYNILKDGGKARFKSFHYDYEGVLDIN